MSTRMAAFVFCDLVGSTALQSRLGDDAADPVRRSVFDLLREAVVTRQGEEVKTLGDGMMAAFTSAADALDCAIAMQRGIGTLADRVHLELSLRIGVSAGEATREAGDWFGTPVIEAARLCSQAAGGQILTSEMARGLAVSRRRHSFRPIGAMELKGLPDSVVVHEAEWESFTEELQEDLGLAAPAESEMRLSESLGVEREAQAPASQLGWFARFSWRGWVSVAAMATPLVVGVVRLLPGLGRPFVPSGDQAILELGVRNALAGAQRLGPYFRSDLNEPGPAYFFVQAPFYALTGSSSRALFFGALVLNLGCAIGVVLVVRHRMGETVAHWAAALVATYLVLLTPAVLLDPGRSNVLALPLLLTAVLAAGGAAGSTWSLGGAVLIGSLVAQTDVAAAAAVAAVLATCGGLWFYRRPPLRRRRRSGIRRLAPLAALSLFALLWVPPLWEQAHGNPGNLTGLVRFFGSDDPEIGFGKGHSVTEATESVAGQLSLVPFGRETGAAGGGGGRKAVAAAGVAVAAAVVAVGRRRRQSFALALGLSSLAGTVAAVWAASRLVGVLLPSAVLWASPLLLPAWIGAAASAARWDPSGGIRLARPSPRTRRTVVTRLSPRTRRTVVILAAVAPAAALTWSVARAPLPQRPASEVAELTAIGRGWLDGVNARSVHVVTEQNDEWPVLAGLVLQLDKDGFGVSVDDIHIPRFGEEFRGAGPPDATVEVAPVGRGPSRITGAERLGQVGSHEMWAARRV